MGEVRYYGEHTIQQPVLQYWTLWEKSGITASTRSSNPCSSTGHYGRSQVLWRAHDPATRAPVLDTVREVRYYGEHTIQQTVSQYCTLWEKSGIMASTRSSNPCSSTGHCERCQVLWRAHDGRQHTGCCHRGEQVTLLRSRGVRLGLPWSTLTCPNNGW